MTVQKWREAHPELYVPEDVLASLLPLPSLHANDFLTYLASQGEKPEVTQFVRDISREMAWAYDGWAKAQRDASATRLLGDLLNNCRGDAYYAPIAKFLRDYARANAIPLPGDPQVPPWMAAVSGVETIA